MLNSTVRPRSLRSTALSSYTFLICLIRPHSPTSMLNAMVESGLALNFAQIDHPPTSTAPSFQSQDPASDHPTSPCGCECQCSSPTAFSEAAELKQAEAIIRTDRIGVSLRMLGRLWSVGLRALSQRLLMILMVSYENLS